MQTIEHFLEPWLPAARRASLFLPAPIRPRPIHFAAIFAWIMSAAISWTFPIIAASSAAAAFTFYALCMVGQLLWVIFVMPETKGVSLEAIQRRLGIE